MPSLSTGIHLALQAVLAHAQTIEIIEHNVANANTPGYHRQSAVLSASAASPVYAMDHGPGAGQRGTGVLIERIQRFNLAFFDGRYRSVSAETSAWTEQHQVLAQVEVTLAETSGDGLLTRMDEFFAGWQRLASDPNNLSVRQNLIEQGRALTMAFNRRAEHLTAIRADQVAGLSDRVAEVNKLAGQVAELNKEISHVLSVGEQPNDLLDSRDMALDRLAELTGAVSHLQSNGEVLVSIGGHVLVTGHEAVALAAGPVNPGGPFTIRWADGGSYQPPAGEIKGLWEAYNTIVPAQLDQLDRLAQALRDQVNARHVTGFGLAGETGQAFFGGSGARDLVIDANLTASAVAAAKQAGKPGDGSLAADLFALKSDTTTMAGTSFHGAYNAQITDFGLKVQAARQNAFHHDLIRKALGEQRESVAGVSLDEEAANLAKAQRAYQAAARVMTVYDEMLDRIINGLGLVGR